MNNFKDFVSEYSGAIIGAVIAILILLTGLYKLIIGNYTNCDGHFYRKLCSKK